MPRKPRRGRRSQCYLPRPPELVFSLRLKRIRCCVTRRRWGIPLLRHLGGTIFWRGRGGLWGHFWWVINAYRPLRSSFRGSRGFWTWMRWPVLHILPSGEPSAPGATRCGRKVAALAVSICDSLAPRAVHAQGRCGIGAQTPRTILVPQADARGFHAEGSTVHDSALFPLLELRRIT